MGLEARLGGERGKGKGLGAAFQSCLLQGCVSILLRLMLRAACVGSKGNVNVDYGVEIGVEEEFSGYRLGIEGVICALKAVRNP